MFAFANNACVANTSCEPDPKGINGLLTVIFLADPVLIGIGCRLAVPPPAERPVVRYFS